MMFFDPLYLLFALPGMLLALYAQFKVKSTFGHYSRVPTSRGLSGAEVAQAILRVENVRGVRVEPTQGFLSDHYDPRSRTLRLSNDVYHGRSVAAAGVAAHEVGHAIQHARAYAFLSMRSALVPLLGITSNLAMPTIVIGFVLSGMGVGIGSLVIFIGLILFATLVLFQIVTLPVELDASRRALVAIEHGGLAQGEELAGARRVLSAAALTYIAAALSSLLTLLYFVLRSGLLGGTSRND
jgi:Zn-dependent membrane protease YugP